METYIIDAHHHIWRRSRLPWLNGPEVPRIFGPHEALRRDYSIAEFAEDVRPCGVKKSVYVQANVAPGAEVEEVFWAREQGKTHDLVQAVVGFADISGPRLAETLEAQMREPAFKGVRQQLHWHEEPAYRFAAGPDTMSATAFRRGFQEIASRNLLFELQLFPEQFRQGLELVDAFPKTQFVLLHAGMPISDDEDYLGAWRDGLRAFALRSNVAVKLSGFGTFKRRCTLPDWKPPIMQTIEIFGSDRCVFGSNFPIEKIWTSYHELISVFMDSIGDLSNDEKVSILHKNAERIYGI